jgi:transposase
MSAWTSLSPPMRGPSATSALECLYDNARTQVLGWEAGRVLWHPVFEDFARYWGFTPRACQPYRAKTKGKTESGVKYVKRNALVGRRFGSWSGLNDWLAEWTAWPMSASMAPPTSARSTGLPGR